MNAQEPPVGWQPIEPEDLPEELRALAQHEGSLVTQVRSLQELIHKATGRGQGQEPLEDPGFAEVHPFPFLALVGMEAVQRALLLALINPRVGGVLLMGPTGVGKTTAVRSLAGVLPRVPRSLCYYGCLPQDVEEGGLEAVCASCAEKYRRGEPLAVMEPARLLEIPYPVQPEEVWGTLDERAARRGRHRLRRGLLGQADRHVLLVDEITRYPAEIQEAVVEAAAQGYYTLSRGGLTAVYRSQFVLVATMNPQRGRLPFHVLDRFGLRVALGPLEAPRDRVVLWERWSAWRRSPRAFVAAYEQEQAELRREIERARERLPRVQVPEDVVLRSGQMLAHLGLSSMRTLLALLEAARAHAAAEERETVSPKDVRETAPLVLLLRRIDEVEAYFRALHVDVSPVYEAFEQAFAGGGGVP